MLKIKLNLQITYGGRMRVPVNAQRFSKECRHKPFILIPYLPVDEVIGFTIYEMGFVTTLLISWTYFIRNPYKKN